MKRKGMAFLVVSLWLGASQFATTQDVIFLVRHADRASSEPDSLLSKAGEARAQCLAQGLNDVALESIDTTEIKRTGANGRAGCS
jgi:hypothetical protein